MLNSYTADQLLQTQEMGMSFHYLFPADLADDLGEDPMLAVNLFDIRRSEMFLSFRTNYSDIGDVVVLFMPRFMCLLRFDHDECVCCIDYDESVSDAVDLLEDVFECDTFLCLGLYLAVQRMMRIFGYGHTEH